MIDIEKVIKDKSSLIDKEIRSVFPEKGINNLNDAVWYHLNTGGKRLRPVLAILTCEALGGETKKILPFAAACEILHSWLLIHDDIEDGDKVRRNLPALWVKYGIAHGINVGDYMSQKVFELILNSKKYGVDNETIFKLIDVMVITSVHTAEGQTMDMNLRNNNNPTEKDYLNMVMGKTGYYMTVPIIGGVIIAKHENLIKNIIEFGRLVGPAFQISDDILDLTEGKGRGEIGRDIKEGKRSIIVIHCLSKCNVAEKKKLLEILNKPVEDTTNKDVAYAIGIFNKYKSIDYSKKRAEELIENAKKITKSMPELKEILNFFAEYMINRKK